MSRTRPFQQHFGHLVGPRAFYRETMIVMIPVVSQQLISSGFGFVDNLMVGLVNAQTLAGVAVANKYFFVFSGVFWGITGAFGMLLSQYFGADDHEECQRLFAMQIVTGTAISLLVTLLLLIFPRPLLHLFVQDPQTLAAGLAYLQLVSFSYLPAAVSMVCMFSLRAVGQNQVALIAGFLAIGCNLFLNWVFIFGNLGVPAMGASGAALATLIARMIEAGFFIFWIGSGRSLFSWQLGKVRQLSRFVLKMAVAKAIPLTFNEINFTVGMSILFWAFARISEQAVPALVIAEQAMNLIMTFYAGMAATVAILVGKRLGSGQFAAAKINADRLLALYAGVGLLTGIIAVLAAPGIAGLFAISAELRQLATTLIVIQAGFNILAFLYANGFFILRAGGDMRSTLLLDSAFLWLIPIPAALGFAILMPRPLTLSLPLIYLIIQVLTNLRIIPTLYFLKKGRWLRNLTARPADQPVELVVGPDAWME